MSRQEFLYRFNEAASYPSHSPVINPMQIKPQGTRPLMPADPEYFTGPVSIDPLHKADAPARTFAVNVTFQPGARTVWHTHPLGQLLFITAGQGRAQRWGGPVEHLQPGDVVWISPNEKHWHGAAPDTAVTHVAITEQTPDDQVVDWLEPVTDEQYLA